MAATSTLSAEPRSKVGAARCQPEITYDTARVSPLVKAQLRITVKVRLHVVNRSGKWFGPRPVMASTEARDKTCRRTGKALVGKEVRRPGLLTASKQLGSGKTTHVSERSVREVATGSILDVACQRRVHGSRGSSHTANPPRPPRSSASEDVCSGTYTQLR